MSEETTKKIDAQSISHDLYAVIGALNAFEKKFPYLTEDIEPMKQTCYDASDFIKIHIPRPPKRDIIGEWVCPKEKCHHRLRYFQSFCDLCGQAVDWIDHGKKNKEESV